MSGRLSDGEILQRARRGHSEMTPYQVRRLAELFDEALELAEGMRDALDLDDGWLYERLLELRELRGK